MIQMSRCKRAIKFNSQMRWLVEKSQSGRTFAWVLRADAWRREGAPRWWEIARTQDLAEAVRITAELRRLGAKRIDDNLLNVAVIFLDENGWHMLGAEAAG